MWTTVQSLPNEPGLLVSVEWTQSFKVHFGPRKGEVVSIRRAMVGCSRRDVSIEAASDNLAVRWQFIAGLKSGGDNLEREPALLQQVVDLVGDSVEVCKVIEQKLGLHSVEHKVRWSQLQDV
jgi:hypothetical protein